MGTHLATGEHEVTLSCMHNAQVVCIYQDFTRAMDIKYIGISTL